MSITNQKLPLDGLPQEMYKPYWIIKVENILTKGDVYLYDPKVSSFTEDIEGAYRYTDSELGHEALWYDIEDAEAELYDRGVHFDRIVSEKR